MRFKIDVIFSACRRDGANANGLAAELFNEDMRLQFDIIFGTQHFGIIYLAWLFNEAMRFKIDVIFFACRRDGANANAMSQLQNYLMRT
jgi:hypothetical protein